MQRYLTGTVSLMFGRALHFTYIEVPCTAMKNLTININYMTKTVASANFSEFSHSLKSMHQKTIKTRYMICDPLNLLLYLHTCQLRSMANVMQVYNGATQWIM